MTKEGRIHKFLSMLASQQQAGPVTGGNTRNKVAGTPRARVPKGAPRDPSDPRDADGPLKGC